MLTAAWVQAYASIAIVVVTFLIWCTYLRQKAILIKQAETMEKQAALTEAQTELQTLQKDVSELVSNAELAPLLLPTWSESFPLAKNSEGTPLKNMGRGCAFEISISAWWVGSSGQERIWGPGVDACFLAAGDETRLRSPSNGHALDAMPADDDSVEVTVLHYKDFLGREWHTTWNLDPDTGRARTTRAPFVWDRERWKKSGGATGLCAYCSGS